MSRIWTKLNKQDCFGVTEHAAWGSCDRLYFEWADGMVNNIESVFEILERNLFEKCVQLCFDLFSLVEKVVLLAILFWQQLI